jgi:gliding motility-associated-like protein
LPLLVPPVHGVLVLEPGGNFSYQPAPGFTGSDFAVARICDTGFPLPSQCSSDTLFFDINQLINALAGDDTTLCNSTGTILSGNDPQPGTGRWVWIAGPDTAQVIPTGPSTAFADGLIPGNYRFAYFITNGGCISSDTLELQNIPQAPPASAGPDQIVCYHSGDSLTLQLNASQPITGAGRWLQHSGPSTVLFQDPLNPSTFVSGFVSGMYEFIWKITADPCPATADSMTITIHPAVIAAAGPDSGICASHPVWLNKAYAMNSTSVEWKTTGSGSFNNPATIQPEYVPMADSGSGEVLLILTAYPLEGCSEVKDTLKLIVTPPPSVAVGPDAYTCPDRLIHLHGEIRGGGGSFKWNHTGNGSLLYANSLNPVYQPGDDEPETIQFFLYATGNDHCIHDTASDQGIIFMFTSPTVEAGPDTLIGEGTSVWLNAMITGGSGDYTSHWQPESLFDDPTRPDPHTALIGMDTTLFLQVIDNLTGCIGYDSLRITVSSSFPQPGEECLRLYNSLTPNGDGLNDSWIIDCIETFPANRLVIVDRWGNPVAEFENYNNRSVVWKGTTKNEKSVPDGTYYYILTIRDGGTYTGWILVRGGQNSSQ